MSGSGRTSSELDRVRTLGIDVSAVNPDQAVQVVEDWVARDVHTYVCVSDAHLLVRGSEDPELQQIMNEAGMVLPDGQPLVWAGHLAGARHMARTSGPDFFPRVMAMSAERGWTHFLLGGAPGVADGLKQYFEGKHPGLRIVGTNCPPFRPLTSEEDAQLVEQINAARPTFVWVGLGAPKQERWMHDHRPKLDANVLFGVGAAFDFSAGTVGRAPRWMQRSGLEWVHRMTQEPKRLLPRYRYTVPRFILGVLRTRPQLLPGRVD